jgi:tetratricopeptide (TPR) repeat protein
VTPEDLPRIATAAPAQAHRVARRILSAETSPTVRICALRAAGVAAKELGRLEEGLAHLAEALRIAGRFPYAAAQVRMNLVGLLTACGDTSAALSAARAAAEVLVGADADRLAANRACALARAGRLEEALGLGREALPRLRGSDDPSALAGLLTNLGLVQTLQGRLEKAAGLLTEAVATAERAGLFAQAAMAQGNLAYVVARCGDVSWALRLYESAEPRLTGERLTQCRLDKAEMLLGAGLASEARPLLERALTDASARGYACDRADALLLRAHADLAEDDAEQAAAYAERARAEFAQQHRPGRSLLAEHVLLKARWAAGDRSPVFLRTAMATAERLLASGLAEPAADVRILAARLALHHGRPARDLLTPVGGTAPVRLRVAAWHAAALERSAAGDRRGAAAAVWSGLRVADEDAGRLGALELRARAAAHSQDLAEHGLRQARSARELLVTEERRRAIARPITITPADPARASLLAELRTANAAGSEDVPRLESAVRTAACQAPARNEDREILRVTRLTQMLGERALVELVRIGGELHAVTVAGGRCQRWPLGSYEAAARDARLVRFALDRLNRGGDGAGFVQAVEQAAVKIPAELCQAVGERDLVIIPVGALHALPWAALPSLRKRPFTIAPSAAAWLHAAQHPDRPGRTVLAAGPGLAHARAEVAALTRLYPTAAVLTGPHANAANILTAMDGARMVHIAAHGEFRADHPLLSHLGLADGPLMAYDLEQPRTSPATVVLSACDAARSGTEALGLVSILLALGTTNVIASVTPVADAATRSFMPAFHTNLQQTSSPAQALAALPRAAGTLGFQCFGAGWRV